MVGSDGKLAIKVDDSGQESKYGDAVMNCGIILTIDGSFKAFTNGIDVQALQRPEEELTEVEKAQVEMARKLTALTVALSNEQIMAVLYDLAANTDILKLRPENAASA